MRVIDVNRVATLLETARLQKCTLDELTEHVMAYLRGEQCPEWVTMLLTGTHVREFHYLAHDTNKRAKVVTRIVEPLDHCISGPMDATMAHAYAAEINEGAGVMVQVR